MDDVNTGTKECPRCAEDIPVDSTSCQHCGSEIPLLSLKATSQEQPSKPPNEQDDLKDCPFCGEQIKREAIKCRHCQSNLETVVPKAKTAPASAAPKVAPTKRCPDCAEEILLAANKCKHCGSVFGAASGRSMPGSFSPQQMPATGQQLVVVVSDRLVRPDTDPLMMTLVSCFCFNGLSQIVMGQVGKGIVIFLMAHAIAACTFGISLVVTWPLTVIDTYRIAAKLKRGQEVGKWEFF